MEEMKPLLDQSEVVIRPGRASMSLFQVRRGRVEHADATRAWEVVSRLLKLGEDWYVTMRDYAWEVSPLADDRRCELSYQVQVEGELWIVLDCPREVLGSLRAGDLTLGEDAFLFLGQVEKNSVSSMVAQTFWERELAEARVFVALGPDGNDILVTTPQEVWPRVEGVLQAMIRR